MLALLNPGTADKLQLVTSAAGNVDVHASHIDATVASPPVPDQPSRTNTNVTTATTTDIVAGPASGRVRNIKTLHVRNKSTSVSNDVTVIHNISGGTAVELHKVTLRPGDTLEYIEGVGFFTIANLAALTNKSTAAQGAGFASDTYLTGSSILIPAGSPVVGTVYVCSFDMTKTAAGVAASVITVRIGTAGTTGDTARNTLTFGAGTAAADTGVFTVAVEFRSVGSGTSAVTVGRGHVDCLPSSGISSTIKGVVNVSSGFDSTVANSIIGLSFNGGTSFAGTAQGVIAELRSY